MREHWHESSRIRTKSINNALGVVRRILNQAARSWRDEARGEDSEADRMGYVFMYRGRRIGKMNNTAWKRAWQEGKLPVDDVHKTLTLTLLKTKTVNVAGR